MLLHRHVVVLHVGQPVHYIPATVEARAARRLANGQEHLAARQVQVFRDLRAGLAGAHHQHAAFGQGLRATVLGGLDLPDAGRQALGHARHDRRVIAAGGHHHLPGCEVALRGSDKIAALLQRFHAPDLGVLQHRGVHHADKAVKVRGDLILLHEAVRVVALVGIAGQGALPVRRDQAEGIPALAAPGVGDGVLLDHEMIDAGLLEVVAHGQASLATADDDDAVVLGSGAGGLGFVGGGRHVGSFFECCVRCR